MPDPMTRAGVRELIQAHGLRTKKKLGQHFLVDKHVAGKILAAAEIRPSDLVLEIGPGLGGLTQGLASAAGHVVAVELDKTLVEVLEDMFQNSPVTIVQGDILRMDLSKILPPWDDSVKVVANLPYYITTPVIFFLFESGIRFESVTVMVQKEVAKRIVAVPGTKDYGALTLAANYYADAEIVANVPVNSFMPRPAVDSAVVKFQLLDKPRAEGDKDFLFKVIHAAFGKRRKTLVNALDSEGLGGEGGKMRLADILSALGIDTQVRGETLDIHGFAKLAAELSKPSNPSAVPNNSQT